MAEFVYEAIDNKGKKVRGNVVAENEILAISQLKSKGYYVIELNEKNILRASCLP